MNKRGIIIGLLVLGLLPFSLMAQSESKATSVYRITANDYLPDEHSAKDYVRPPIRRAASRPSFVLPESFFLIAGPIVLVLVLFVIVTFLKEFEASRKEDGDELSCERFNIQ